MDAGGRAISIVVVARWAFEALGADLDLTSLLAGDRAGAGPAILAEYGDTFGHSPARNWIVLILFTCAFVAATASVIRRRTTS
jgi:hypothetical protein